MSVSDSKPPRKPSNLNTLIRSAPSPPMSQSEDKSLKALWSQPKCKRPLSSEGTISTMFLNTTDIKRDTEISQSTARLLSQSKKVTSLWLDNADPSQKLCTSTSLRLSPTKLSVTLENSLCSSDCLLSRIYFSQLINEPKNSNKIDRIG